MAEGIKLWDEILTTISKQEKEYGPFPPVRKYTPCLGGCLGLGLKFNPTNQTQNLMQKKD